LKNYMRINKRILVTMAALFVFAVSCKDSFLDIKPTSTITDAQLTSKAGMEGQLIGVYSMLSGRGIDFYAGATDWFWGSVMGAEANKGTNSGDQGQMNEVQAYRSTPGNGSVLAKYRATYEGIARANALFRTIADAPPATDPADVTRIKEIGAEGKFLRAVYYFELARMFNKTPYIDENVDYANGINDVKNDKPLWPFIEADLTAAIADLPDTQGQPGRANKSAAKAYLAKAYLYQKKYDLAKTLFTELITSGQNASGDAYDLMPAYGDLFRIANDNNAETVFAIQSAAGTGSIANANPDFVLNYPYNGGPAGCCGFFQPSFDQVNSFRTIGGLPPPGNTHRNSANELKTDQGVPSGADWAAGKYFKEDTYVNRMAPGNVARLYKVIKADSANSDPLTSPADYELTWEEDLGTLDPRLDHAVGRKGIPYMDHGRHPGAAWIRDQEYGGPYAPKKYLWSKAEEAANGVDKSSWTPGYTAHNIYLIRFADILLMAAEAEIESSTGSLATALGYINRVRTRAANVAGYVMDGTFPAANYNIANYGAFADAAAAREALMKERRLELSGEGHRFFDLVRWGVAAAELNDYLAYEKTKVGASPFIGATFTAGKSEYQPIPQTEIDVLGSSILAQNPGY
jgi:hypothetical protein